MKYFKPHLQTENRFFISHIKYVVKSYRQNVEFQTLHPTISDQSDIRLREWPAHSVGPRLPIHLLRKIPLQ